MPRTQGDGPEIDSAGAYFMSVETFEGRPRPGEPGPQSADHAPRPRTNAEPRSRWRGSPLRVYGSAISYFTGKLEAYLRFKEIPYELRAMTPRYMNRIIPRKIGVMQMPAVELPDGRWISDTTPMIAWFESQHPEPAVIPRDPLQAFLSRLLEDYADEWLWRAAMHYRWSHAIDRRLLGDLIVSELLRGIPLPRAIKRAYIQRRQLRIFVRGDGVTRRTRAHVENGYLRALDLLGAIFAERPYLLGDRPSLADFGFFGPMARHFGHDPTPHAIMRARAPAVAEWVARLWNATASRSSGGTLADVPADWAPLLDEIGATHLEQLAANARAWGEEQDHFDAVIQGVRYARLPTSRYRVWCLEQLRAHFLALPLSARERAQSLLARHGCWEPLWRATDARSGHDPRDEAPFTAGLRVFRRTN